MTTLQRIGNYLSAIFMILAAVLFIVNWETSYLNILSILIIALNLRAFQMLWYYFSLARYMTGGRQILYRGLLYFDLGLFAFSLKNIPSVYVLIYLSALLGFSGFADVLGALDAKKIHGKWKLKLARGIGTILLMIAAFVFIDSQYSVVIIYSISLIYNAVMRIANVLRPQEVVVIQ